MVYQNISRNEFDWSWEQSLDSGKTWKVLWPIHYKRKAWFRSASDRIPCPFRPLPRYNWITPM